MNSSSLEDLILKEDLRGLLKFSSFELQKQIKLSKKTLAKMNKMAANSQNILEYYLCGLIYLAYFSHIELEKAEDDLISVTTSNILFSISEHLKGARLTNKLFSYLLQILEILSMRNANQDYNIIESLVKENNNFWFSRLLAGNEIEEIFKPLINLAKTDKLQALNDYIAVFNRCLSLQEQMTIFTEKSSSFLSALLFEDSQNSSFNSPNFLYPLTKFVDSLVFEYSYELELDKELFQNVDDSVCKTFDSQKSTILKKSTYEKEKIFVEYKYGFLNEILQQCPNFLSSIYPLLIFLVKHALVDDKSVLDSQEQEKKSEILKILVSIFNRIYFNFPYENEKLLEYILEIFNIIDQSLNFYEDAKNEAAKFIKRYLKNFSEQTLLEKLTKYSSIYNKIKNPDNNDISLSNTIEDLSIKDGFPLNVAIDAGGAFEQIIDVWYPNSILHLAFATKWYDINFQISFLGDFEEKDPKEIVLLKGEKISFEKNAYRLSLLLKKTGLYKICFDNNHSWFKGKELRYRVFLLEPDKCDFKYVFPFQELVNSEEKSSIESKKKHSKSKYYISEYKAVLLLDKKGLHFLASQPSKSYEMSIEIDQFNLMKFKDRVVNALKKTFSENLHDFFQNKLLSFALVQNSNRIKFPINENSNEEMSAIDAFHSIVEDLKINFKESVINGKEIIMEFIKKQINYNNSMDTDNILLLFSENDELYVILLTKPNYNFADLIFSSENDKKTLSFRTAFKKNNNKHYIGFLCLLNAIIFLGHENIKNIIINKPGIIDIDILKDAVPHESIFTQVLKEIELETLEEGIMKIDISYLNISMKIDDLILL